VVTTLCTGSRDAVLPEVTGLLIPPGYPVAISEAVLQLLRSPKRRCRMGLAARAWVLDHYVTARAGPDGGYYQSLLVRNLTRDSRVGPVSTGTALSPI